MPSYDPRAPVPGRKRGVLVVGLAGVAALILAAALYGQAQSRKAAEPPPAAVVEPARDLTNRAQAALAANQIDHALELAHLALTADARFADAHFVVGTVAQGRNQAATGGGSAAFLLCACPYSAAATISAATPARPTTSTPRFRPGTGARGS